MGAIATDSDCRTNSRGGGDARLHTLVGVVSAGELFAGSQRSHPAGNRGPFEDYWGGHCRGDRELSTGVVGGVLRVHHTVWLGRGVGERHLAGPWIAAYVRWDGTTLGCGRLPWGGRSPGRAAGRGLDPKRGHRAGGTSTPHGSRGPRCAGDGRGLRDYDETEDAPGCRMAVVGKGMPAGALSQDGVGPSGGSCERWRRIRDRRIRAITPLEGHVTPCIVLNPLALRLR